MSTSYSTEHCLFVGSPRTGKTTWLKTALAIILERRRESGIPSNLVIFDRCREYYPRGAHRVQGRKEFLMALRAGRFPLVIDRPNFLDWRPLEDYPHVVLVVDEAQNYCGPNSIHDSFLSILCERGHTISDVFVASQRPRVLHMNARTLSTWRFALPLEEETDRTAMGSMQLPESMAEWKRDAEGHFIPFVYRAGIGMVPPP